MTLVDYLQLLRRRWYLIVAALLVGGAGATAATHELPKVYASTVTFYVSDSQGRPVSTLLAGSAEDRISTYAALVTSKPVVSKVVAALPAGASAGSLSVTATPVVNTIFMDLTAHGATPLAAYEVAQAYADVLPSYISRFEGAGSTTDVTTLRVLSAPAVSPTPVSPNSKRDLILGLALGLVVGLCGILIMNALDSRMRKPEDAERATDLPILAAVPVELRKEPLVVATRPRSQRAEAIRQLRTNIQFAGVDRPIRSVVVTSALGSEGKTSIATNLAVSFASMGKRVVLVDADLRNPSVADFLGLDGSLGLTNVLIGDVEPTEALQLWGEDRNLAVLAAGPKPANPSELLGSERMAWLLDSLAKPADLVVIDTPPVLPVTDAAVLGRRADGVVLITRMESTKRAQVKAAAAELKKLGLPVLGVVANFSTPHGQYRYYAYGEQRGSGRGGGSSAGEVSDLQAVRANRRGRASAGGQS